MPGWSPLEGFRQAVDLTVAGIQNLFGLPRPEVLPVLTFEAVVDYFVKERPHDPKVHHGALLRQKHSSGQMVIQVFLNQDNELCFGADERKPYGRKLIVAQMDDELSDLFEGKELLMFK